MTYKLRTNSPEDTVRLGFDIGEALEGAHTILLLGGMGAGKTAITRGIVEGIGIDDDVSSPTYTLVNEYEDPTQSVYHFDLYRLESTEALYEMGFEDYLAEGSTLIIEWPQIALDYPFKNKVVLTLETLLEDCEARCITVDTEDAKLVQVLKQKGW